MSKPVAKQQLNERETAAENLRRHLREMTPAEGFQSLVDAGIFTPKGNPTKPYRGVFRKIPATKD